MKLHEDPNNIAEWMCTELGYETWIKFCRMFGGQHWWIPTTPALSARDAQIKRLYVDLMKTPNTKQKIILSKLSFQFNISISTLKRIVR